jgi:hypothetical protein
MPKILLRHRNTNSGGLSVTITSKVVVYAPAETADTLTLFLLYPFLLCGAHRHIIYVYSYCISSMLAGSDVSFATALRKENSLWVNVRVHCTQNKPATVANILRDPINKTYS